MENKRIQMDDYPELYRYATRDETQSYIDGLSGLLFLDEDEIGFKARSVQKAISNVYKAVAIGVLADTCLEMLNKCLPGKEGSLTPIALLDTEGEDYYYNPDEQTGGWRE